VGFHNVTSPHILLNQDQPCLSAAVSSVVIATTAISFLPTLYHAYQGYLSIRDALHNNNIEIGVRRARARSLGGEETMTLSHKEYMEYIPQQVGLEGKKMDIRNVTKTLPGRRRHTSSPPVVVKTMFTPSLVTTTAR
jgi:hypothetical protein